MGAIKQKNTKEKKKKKIEKRKTKTVVDSYIG